jgi:hypothetical protein
MPPAALDRDALRVPARLARASLVANMASPKTEYEIPTKNIWYHPVLWIRNRIRKDPKLFAGSGSVTRGYGSGSETGLKTNT